MYGVEPSQPRTLGPRPRPKPCPPKMPPALGLSLEISQFVFLPLPCSAAQALAQSERKRHELNRQVTAAEGEGLPGHAGVPQGGRGPSFGIWVTGQPHLPSAFLRNPHPTDTPTHFHPPRAAAFLKSFPGEADAGVSVGCPQSALLWGAPTRLLGSCFPHHPGPGLPVVPAPTPLVSHPLTWLHQA